MYFNYKFLIMKAGRNNTIKHKSDLFQQEVTLTVDENLNRLKGKVLAPKKLAAANRALKKLKGSLPK